MTDETQEKPGSDGALLKEIRTEYRRYLEAWKDQHEHREKLMRYLCGDPWSDEDKKARAGRPCISHDELNQYVFQCVNAARQNKRAIKIEPAGNGATDKTAKLREDIARTIEYRSKAQSIYLQAYQDEVEGGYGFLRISRRYISDDSNDQEILIRPIPNPDSVLYSPDCKEADWSDARGVFVLDPIEQKEFQRLYPDADVVDFTDDDGSIRNDWVNDDKVLLAEYWKIIITRVKGKTGRLVEKKSVVQYITNGAQILETNPQPGTEIPIVPFIGLQRFVKENGGVRRRLFALASLAMDAQLRLAFYESLEAEQAGLIPKVPYLAYVGQIETDKDAWDGATKIPRAYLLVDPIPDGANGQVLPLPQRQQWAFQSLEAEKESAKRAIQASMGITPLPTSAQRQNDKSGVALKQIQANQDTGSYHFVAGLERGITRTGRIIDSWIPVIYDTTREMGLHKNDETREVKTLNMDQPDPETGETNKIGDEDHDVTIGTGPSQDSEREAVSDFLDLLTANLEKLPPPGSPQAKIMAMAIRMKNLGPKGDVIADILDPPQDGQQIPPQAQAAIQKGQQEMQQMHAYAQQLEGEVQKLTFEKQAQVVKHQGDMELERLKIEADITKAEITTKAQSIEERVKFVEDMVKQFHVQAHERAIQAEDHGQAQNLAEQTQQHTQENMQQQAALEPQLEPVAGA